MLFIIWDVSSRTCLWGSEIDDNRRAVFKANHLDCHLIEVDLTERNFKQFNKQLYDEVDVYTAGVPCQPFSMAGNAEGAADGQGRGVVGDYVIKTIQA